MCVGQVGEQISEWVCVERGGEGERERERGRDGTGATVVCMCMCMYMCMCMCVGGREVIARSDV